MDYSTHLPMFSNPPHTHIPHPHPTTTTTTHSPPLTPKVPPGCKPYIASLLIGATSLSGDPEYLSQHLSAAGKRMAIEVCFSQVCEDVGGKSVYRGERESGRKEREEIPNIAGRRDVEFRASELFLVSKWAMLIPYYIELPTVIP